MISLESTVLFSVSCGCIPKVPNIILSTSTNFLIFSKLCNVVHIVNNFVIPTFFDLLIISLILLNNGS